MTTPTLEELGKEVEDVERQLSTVKRQYKLALLNKYDSMIEEAAKIAQRVFADQDWKWLDTLGMQGFVTPDIYRIRQEIKSKISDLENCPQGSLSFESGRILVRKQYGSYGIFLEIGSTGDE